ncbi:MAG TPA: transcription antitermination factor NusB [Desulfotomaculum sp.]|nr:MAG: nitrogen utilization protein B [Desulfotomaculum sp. BICA1-6]HBX24396.1 transcription antitermination factor NusB [Desulfotomaculum sp.]
MSRRKARESAMQVLYQVDVGKMDVEDAFQHLQEKLNINIEDRDLDFARHLVLGAIDKLPELDSEISRLSRDWKLERIAAVDRSILRMALYEIFYDPGTPYNVSINEAVEIAKKFCGDQSSKFINGILGKVVQEKQKVTQ